MFPCPVGKVASAEARAVLPSATSVRCFYSSVYVLWYVETGVHAVYLLTSHIKADSLHAASSLPAQAELGYREVREKMKAAKETSGLKSSARTQRRE